MTLVDLAEGRTTITNRPSGRYTHIKSVSSQQDTCTFINPFEIPAVGILLRSAPTVQRRLNFFLFSHPKQKIKVHQCINQGSLLMPSGLFRRGLIQIVPASSEDASRGGDTARRSVPPSGWLCWEIKVHHQFYFC